MTTASRNTQRTLTKAELVEQIYERVSLSKPEAAAVVEYLFETLKSQLAAGQTIKLSGFGNFVVRDKKPRPGRNPQTGAALRIDARRVITFRPSQLLREELNQGGHEAPSALHAGKAHDSTLGHSFGGHERVEPILVSPPDTLTTTGAGSRRSDS